ncbi:centrosomal protein of 63 kDa-like [Neocloeon triangulifer]|uniref:centrosomal protein of 63 kDa-like n=1 Tax=Neocloeon triangulifer TaxID=2078957 RepID=UPI00286FA789|nr:centrosomal protein of 63 kDa-like [Neocloeon triangulifer]
MKPKGQHAAEPEALQSMNLLELRHIRDLLSDITKLECKQISILKSNTDPVDETVLQLENVRTRIRELEQSLAQKETCIKEQQLRAAEANFEAEAATVEGKMLDKLKLKFLKGQARIEQEHKESLRKQIIRLSRRQLCLKLAETQFLFTRPEMFPKYAKERLRLERMELLKLEHLLMKYKNVNFEEARSLTQDLSETEPAEKEMDDVSEETEYLASNIRDLKKKLKKRAKESEERDVDLFEIDSVNDDNIILQEMELDSEELQQRMQKMIEIDFEQAEILEKLKLMLQTLSDKGSPALATRMELCKRELADLERELGRGTERLADIEECKMRLMTEKNKLMDLIAQKKELEATAQSTADVLQTLRSAKKDLQQELHSLSNTEKEISVQTKQKSRDFEVLSAQVLSVLQRLESRAAEHKHLLSEVRILDEELEKLEEKKDEELGAAHNESSKIYQMQGELESLDSTCYQLVAARKERAAETLHLRRTLDQ